MVLLENKSVVFIHDRFGPKVSLGTLRLPQESMVGRLRRQRLHFSQNGSEGSESVIRLTASAATICEDRQASQTSRLRFPMWFLLQALIFFAVMASNIAWHWALNPYVAALIGVGLAIGATQIVTGIQYLAAVLRRNRRP
jgi:hypothetical protein